MAAHPSNVTVARAVASAALRTPDVLSLHDGEVGEIATYGQGLRVAGVRIQSGSAPRLRVHLVVRFGARLHELAEEVRDRVRTSLVGVAPELAGASIDVRIVDVAAAEEPLPDRPIEEAVRWR